jgi:GntR family transcriptional regulator
MADNVSHLWQVEYESGIPVFRQIINQVCAAVAIGAIRSGDQLPTIRALSERLNVNPNTIAKAYRELELKGVITTERGNGSFVQDPPPVSAFNEKQAKLQSLYQRMLAEAAGLGLTESELLRFIQQKNPATK